MVLVPYYFDYVTAENFLLWHKSIFCEKVEWMEQKIFVENFDLLGLSLP